MTFNKIETIFISNSTQHMAALHQYFNKYFGSVKCDADFPSLQHDLFNRELLLTVSAEEIELLVRTTDQTMPGSCTG
jgi:hypothetical protein